MEPALPHLATSHTQALGITVLHWDSSGHYCANDLLWDQNSQCFAEPKEASGKKRGAKEDGCVYTEEKGLPTVGVRDEGDFTQHGVLKVCKCPSGVVIDCIQDHWLTPLHCDS